MLKIVALGEQEFILGFQLAGISKTIDASKDTEEVFLKTLEDKDIGIIITEEKTISKLQEHIRERVEGLVRPVTVVLSTDTSSQDNLRKLIKKSIGVDLWK